MRTALFVIDVQESFRRRPIWAAISNPDIVDKINPLVETARDKGDLVVWIRHVEPDTGNVFDPARGFVEYLPGLKPLAGEPELFKTSHNAFTTTNAQQILTQHGVGEVVVTGIRTEQCCETNARVASDLGYRTVFVTDATATNPIPHRDAPQDRSLEELLADPRTLGTDAIIERTEYALAGRFATVTGVDALVREWQDRPSD
ncbi:cysteine hydrolase family protein [Glycomyces algeriensis]|uniref:Hydrolase n=1 Tax=Glycomyces algeriensis TaxID=256037 RepID=A0A9W6GB39_9ACTN|nr:isochorismatase family protein [Glycomyces algeriensis]MDA1364772.1 isochorismatase family protein [Glycomyces algeriensis]MDR7350813.1 nicotinamidase-related amidase [Glycomyces algeriensis]GLI43524.1 hydrolase [Glycomyces algeriensis]